jgi:cytoskeletal protein CcmA (bactofilin family)
MTVLGASISVRGEITSEEDLTIDGAVDGPISVRNATLTAGPRARLTGDVRAARVIIEGCVRGKVSATERIELRASALVTGALSANQVVVADHATFNGAIDMDRRTIAVRVAQYKAARS